MSNTLFSWIQFTWLSLQRNQRLVACGHFIKDLLRRPYLISLVGKIKGGRRRGWQRMRWLDGITDSWTWVWVNSGSWWWTGKPAVLQSMVSQRVRHDWATELNWTTWFLKQWDSIDSFGNTLNTKFKLPLEDIIHKVLLSRQWNTQVC